MKTLILGFDSFDPGVFDRMAGNNLLPNLERFSQHGGYSQLEVCSPPQTEVSWTSMATGTDPGGHGIFDFVHRDPATYRPYVSILPMRKGMFGEQFVPPYTAKTFFEETTVMGYPATALWWPAMFPARPGLPVRTLPGLGTPDIRGQLGVGTLFSSENESRKKTTVVKFESAGRDHFQALLPGPQTPGQNGTPRTISIPLSLEILDSTTARLTIDTTRIDLNMGEWSAILELRFKAGILQHIHAVTRFILTGIEGVVRLYALPLQIHPMHTLWQYSSTGAFAKTLWREVGPYLTLGWPQDTTALDEGCITDDQFLDLCQMVFSRRIEILQHLMRGFKDGVLAGIFDDLDRIQHMFFHNRMDIVEDWYRRLDRFVGEVTLEVEGWSGKYRYLILSDHGFSEFRTKIHLNRWLVDQGYLSLQSGAIDLGGADWSKTQAYAVGLNSVYLNIAGREGQGVVTAGDVERILEQISAQMLEWKNEAGEGIIQKVRLKHETFHGPYSRFGPDMIIGYAPGFRGSAETGLGKIPAACTESNTDHWGADHCVDADIVPGVIFANRDLREFGTLSYRDIPFLAIGKHLDQSGLKPPSQAAGEGQKDVAERLKGLGYL